MGYTTSFDGQFALNRKLLPEHMTYLAKFHDTRRMKRDVMLTEKRDDLIRTAARLPVGEEGCFFVGGGGLCGQEGSIFEPDPNKKFGILDYNKPPKGQPGLWCPWEPTADGEGIWIESGGKHYDWSVWLEYLIEHFLKPWGYSLRGRVTYTGEEDGDYGFVLVVNHKVYTNKEPTVLDKIVEALD